MDKVRWAAAACSGSELPWYLTLPGAEGRDIQLIIEAGLVRTTEVGAIAEEDEDRIVAVEHNNNAVLALQDKFPGLRIKQVDFRNLVRGERPIRWPEGEDLAFSRACVINLDLDAPLRDYLDEDGVTFPVIEWIRKLCMVHALSPRVNWVLCLTLHGEFSISAEANEWIRNFFRENVKREPTFAKSCRQVWGGRLFDTVTEDGTVNLCDLAQSDQQLLLSILVPKIIAQVIHGDGWHVQTEHNLRYGGGRIAPMVSWIITFEWSSGASGTAETIYRAALRGIFARIGQISSEGLLELESTAEG